MYKYSILWRTELILDGVYNTLYNLYSVYRLTKERYSVSRV